MTVPVHIAIIMDGNRRWSKKNSLNIFAGHDKGSETLKKIAEYCKKIGVEILTVWGLSLDNFKKRTKEELNYHFKLHKKYIKEEILESDKFVKEKIRFGIIGRKDLLPEDEQKLIYQAEEKTKNFSDFIFNVCICYGGQEEITSAVKKIVEAGIKPDEITEETVKHYLYTSDLPHPEMIIRTGMNPEKRTSGFLLWDSEYSEFFFTKTLWPDFKEEELQSMISEFNSRDRRFGQ